MKSRLKINALVVVVGLNIVLFALPVFLSWLVAEDYSSVVGRLGAFFDTSLLIDQWWWRAVTANFLHADEYHLIGNLLGIVILGRWVNEFYGNKKFFILVMLTGIGGVLASLIFMNNFSTVGASGVYFGILGVIIGNMLRREDRSVQFPFNFTLLILITIYMVARGFVPGGDLAVNNAGHIGGLAVGLLFGFVVPHQLSAGYKRKWLYMLEKAGFWLLSIWLGLSLIAMLLNILTFII